MSKFHSLSICCRIFFCQELACLAAVYSINVNGRQCSLYKQSCYMPTSIQLYLVYKTIPAVQSKIFIILNCNKNYTSDYDSSGQSCEYDIVLSIFGSALQISHFMFFQACMTSRERTVGDLYVHRHVRLYASNDLNKKR